jgi:uncharacterized membrane-anchored protein
MKSKDLEMKAILERQTMEEKQALKWWSCGRIWRYLVILFCPVALFVFLIFEDINLPMTWMNELSGVMLVILGIEIVFLVFYWWQKNRASCHKRLFNSPKFGEDEVAGRE